MSIIVKTPNTSRYGGINVIIAPSCHVHLWFDMDQMSGQCKMMLNGLFSIDYSLISFEFDLSIHMVMGPSSAMLSVPFTFLTITTKSNGRVKFSQFIESSNHIADDRIVMEMSVAFDEHPEYIYGLFTADNELSERISNISDDITVSAAYDCITVMTAVVPVNDDE